MAILVLAPERPAPTACPDATPSPSEPNRGPSPGHRPIAALPLSAFTPTSSALVPPHARTLPLSLHPPVTPDPLLSLRAGGTQEPG